MRSGKKPSSDGPGLFEAFRARISADSIKIHSNGGKHRQTGTHNAMGASAKGNVRVHIETQYPNSNDNPSRPNDGTEIDGDSADISARTVNKSRQAIYSIKKKALKKISECKAPVLEMIKPYVESAPYLWVD